MTTGGGCGSEELRRQGAESTGWVCGAGSREREEGEGTEISTDDSALRLKI